MKPNDTCLSKRGKTCSPPFSLLHLDRTGSLRGFYAVLILMQHIALQGSVWPSPGKKPRQDVDRAILVAIHHESTFHATVGPFPERHGLQIATPTTGFARVAFI